MTETELLEEQKANDYELSLLRRQSESPQGLPEEDRGELSRRLVRSIEIKKELEKAVQRSAIVTLIDYSIGFPGLFCLLGLIVILLSFLF